MDFEKYKYLRFSRFQDVVLWDIKRCLDKTLKSKYPVAELASYLIEEKEKYVINNLAQEYGVLGVNNKEGIFDAYIEKGNNIKQKYKRMETGWIAYNPYRINVGSIGIKTQLHKNDYISPAYVVFRCCTSLLPEFLYLIMRTVFFNSIIRKHTTGSVRQTLSFNTLSTLQVPLPTIKEQKRILSTYYEKIKEAEELEQNASQIEKDIAVYLMNSLGIVTKQDKKSKINNYQYLKFISFKEIYEWGIDIITKKEKREIYKYPVMKIKSLCLLGSGGTPLVLVHNITMAIYLGLKQVRFLMM